MSNHGFTIEDADLLLDPIVDFPDLGAAFERVRPITDFRKDDTEARVLYICRRITPDGKTSNNDDDPPERKRLYVLKCKVQAPSVLAGGLTTPIPGPSTYTKDELKALEKFGDTKSLSLPHLVAWKTAVQGSNGPMPGGYIAYIVMTLMPGDHLMDLKFWSMPKDQQEEIRRAFIPAIKHVWKLGFEPYDCALRNILWEADSKRMCDLLLPLRNLQLSADSFRSSLVDFEHWYPTTKDPINMNEREEMQRWGIISRPPPASHWEEWFYSEGLTKKR